ncbi:hypothetical protein BVRB_1g008290 [Beta vulgaris subsp. vulgaris]|nr:hypothetical protein BVRB_1g008290 [Beta vulgaris subsp. vulgaris]
MTNNTINSSHRNNNSSNTTAAPATARRRGLRKSRANRQGNRTAKTTKKEDLLWCSSSSGELRDASETRKFQRAGWRTREGRSVSWGWGSGFISREREKKGSLSYVPY